LRLGLAAGGGRRLREAGPGGKHRDSCKGEA
jgi:hypothetical protein